MSILGKISPKQVLFLACITLSISLFAKEKEPVPVIKAWRMVYDFGMADTIEADTTWMNFPQRTVLANYAIANAYNGNIVSPVLPKIYFSRGSSAGLSQVSKGSARGLQGVSKGSMGTIFGESYRPFIITPEDVRYYNTNIAYSNIAFKEGFTNGHQDYDLNFSFTGNLKPNLNLGMDLNYMNAYGHYSDQEGKLFNGDIFASYDGKHYGLKASVMYSQVTNFENGGLANPSDLGGLLKPGDLPTRMHGMSSFRYIAGYLNHHYSIGKEHLDTVTDKTVFVPALTIAHTFETNNSVKRYVEHNNQLHYFDTAYFNRSNTCDSVNHLEIRNTLSVTFEEAFNRVLRFGATVYATNECVRYEQSYLPMAPLTPDSVLASRWTNNTRIGGAIYKNTGRFIHYSAEGDVCLVGYKMGEFHVNGRVSSDFPIGKDSMHIQAEAYVKNEEPDYFLQHYRSNHYCWDNDFQKTYRFYVGGRLAYPTQWIKPAVHIGFENVTRHIYFAPNGLPMQHDGNIQILAADIHLDLTTPWFNWENNAVYQVSSDSVLALPTIALYSNLYYHGSWFRHAVQTQWGVSLRYHTSYHAALLNPATGQFMSQYETKVGGYPLMDVYANFYVRSIRLNFFFELSHFNYYFMKHKTYFTMPGYAENPAVFRAGAAWHFWR